MDWRELATVSTDESPTSSGYWYSERRTESADSIELLNELRRYRESNALMRSKVREDMGMGEKDLLALRLLLSAQAQGRAMRQRDLAQSLSIQPASASALVDRLVKDGYAKRTPHPDDRRSIAVEPTDLASRDVRRTLVDMHARMLDVTDAMTPQERGVVTRFLRDLNHAMDKRPEDAGSSTTSFTEIRQPGSASAESS